MMTRFARRFPILSSLALSTLLPLSAAASDQVGTITHIEGSVVLLSSPAKTVEGEGPHVKFDNEYYHYSQAKEGDRLDYGNVLRTTPGSKARVIYDNGDQYNVGDGTAFRVKWNREPAAAPAPQLAMLHGKIRAIISKEGPRNRLTIRTKSATMGVRGTDFFVSSHNAGRDVEVAVLRGAVEVKPQAVDAQPIKVQKGQTAAVEAPAPVEAERSVASQANPAGAAPAAAAPEAPVVKVMQTTQEELAVIHATSVVKETAHRDLASDDGKKIEQLEKKAVETTMKDIKTYDPQLYAKLDTQKIADPEQLNAAVVNKAAETAPKADENRKPFGIDLDDGSDVYKKYFNGN